jgi:uncharacterized protein (PEP-CTERM system associated)
MQPLKYVFLDVADIYRRVPIDNRANSVADNFVTNMTETNMFRVSPYIEYPLSPSLKTRFGYRYTNVWYRVDEGNNSETHSGFVSLKKQFRFGLSTSLNYSYIAYRPQETTDDYDSNKVSVRANYQTARDFNIWGQVGRAEMDFANLPDEDVTFWDVGTNYTFRFSRSTSLGAAYSQSFSEAELTVDMVTQRGTYYRIPGQQIAEFYDVPEELQEDVPDVIFCPDCHLTTEKTSITTGVTESKRFDLFFKTGTLLRLFVNPYYLIEEEIQTEREDKTKGVFVALSRPIGKVISVTLSGMYANQEFEPDGEDSDLYNIGLDLGYQVSEKIIASAAYRYNKKDSNFDFKDYYNNIAWIQAKYSF